MHWFTLINDWQGNLVTCSSHPTSHLQRMYIKNALVHSHQWLARKPCDLLISSNITSTMNVYQHALVHSHQWLARKPCDLLISSNITSTMNIYQACIGSLSSMIGKLTLWLAHRIQHHIYNEYDIIMHWFTLINDWQANLVTCSSHPTSHLQWMYISMHWFTLIND